MLPALNFSVKIWGWIDLRWPQWTITKTSQFPFSAYLMQILKWIKTVWDIGILQQAFVCLCIPRWLDRLSLLICIAAEIQETEGKDFTKTTLKYPVEFRNQTNKLGETDLQVTFYLRGYTRNFIEVTLYQTDPANPGGEVKVWKPLKQNRDSSYLVVTQLDPTEKQEGLFVRYEVLSKKGSVPIFYQTEYFSYDPTVSYSNRSTVYRVGLLVGVLTGSACLVIPAASAVFLLCRWCWWCSC